MKKITCLIIDDEPPAQDILKNYISKVPLLEYAGAAGNAVEASMFLKNHRIDLLFLDIQIPGLLGTDFLRTLNHPPAVIFTTAHRNFAVEGFELNAVDYLLKPISFDRFLKALNKLTADSTSSAIEETEIDQVALNSKSFILVRAERKNLKIPLDTILFIESMRDYIKIVTTSNQVVSKQPISSIETILPPDKFVRIHRSFIVATDKIESFTNETIEIKRHELPISRMYRMEVERILNE